MKNLLRKLHIGGGGGNDEASEEGSKGGSTAKGRPSFSDGIIGVGGGGEPRGGGLSGWLTSVARHALPMQPSTSCQSTNPPCRTSEINNTASSIVDMVVEPLTSPSAKPSITTADNPVSNLIPSINNSNSRNGRALSPVPSLEEYQVQLAMALSVQDDPDEVQLEAAKQISMGAFSSSASTPAEVVAFRYWNYNMLDYDDRIVDGFYDVYGVVLGSNPDTMPSLVDLQGTPLSEDIAWETVLVNRATDPSLKELVMNTVTLAVDSKAVAIGPLKSGLVEKIAGLVAEQMGGLVNDPDEILKCWKEFSDKLKSSHKSIVLPLGRLKVGLARHRALLFKVLADAVGIPCKLVKGHQFTGSDEGALNIIKLDDAREFIVDLMGAPGFLIPSDGSSVGVEAAVDFDPVPGLMKNVKSSPLLAEAGIPKSCSDNNECVVESDAMDTSKLSKCAIQICQEEQSVAILPPAGEAEIVEKVAHAGGRHYRKAMELPPARPTHRRAMPPFAHMRSPSWTEGIGSPAVRDMKVKDVSQYMMTAAKENPGLAKKLQDVLAESGVVAPPHLFTDMSPKQLQSQASENKKLHFANEDQKDCKHAQFHASESNECIGNDGKNDSKDVAIREKVKASVGEVEENPNGRLPKLNSVEGLGKRRPLETSNPGLPPLSAVSSCTKDSQDAAVKVLSVVQETLLPEFAKRVPAAAAAAATAAMVASSMVVAASKTNSSSSDSKFEVPVAAAATATAAVVVARSAFGGRNAEKSGTPPHPICPEEAQKDTQNRKIEDSDKSGKSPQGSGKNNTQSDESNLQAGLEDEEGDTDGLGDCRNKDKHIDSSSILEDRLSNKSNESLSSKSDSVMDDVAEWEIQWEELVIGERIGIGSYGEVYRGDWHGTEVAVKKFLNQDISGDALEEFRSEVRIMKRLRHPNVVLFMGAVTRPPNLSIVTEFIPRGSLYRLIHRSNNQLDERRRMRMALDVAKGMNYFHSCTPVIVHRDLKSPNLLVDKNWVVKVCDFGLSRIKHNTFLSSKSTSGTPEWMAPEVLRNEPSNEKSDVYSFGMILWELATLQQPWGSMNAMQVVGAVAFQHRRLEIPPDVDPIVASIIRQCWQSDPNLRPSFTEILAALKPLQKPIISPRSANTTKPGVLVSRPLPEASQCPTSDNIVEHSITEGKRKDR